MPAYEGIPAPTYWAQRYLQYMLHPPLQSHPDPSVSFVERRPPVEVQAHIHLHTDATLDMEQGNLPNEQNEHVSCFFRNEDFPRAEQCRVRGDRSSIGPGVYFAASFTNLCKLRRTRRRAQRSAYQGMMLSWVELTCQGVIDYHYTNHLNTTYVAAAWLWTRRPVSPGWLELNPESTAYTAKANT